MVRGTGIRLRSFERFVTAIVVLIALPTCLVFAQTSTATILGVVKDPTGALIPGVRITIKHTETGQTRTAISSETGDYNVPLLPVGAYELATTMPGFKQDVRRGINLVVGQQAVINLTLEVGAAAEQVTVTEEAPLVNTTLSSTSGLITEQQVKELPLDARDFIQPQQGPIKRHQCGGTIGGPLMKDKLFVFGNYEGFQQRRGQSNRSVYPDVPSRQGLLPCYLAYPTNIAANCADRAALVPVPNLQRGMLPFANNFWPVPNGPEVLQGGLPTGTAYNYNSGVQKVGENFVMTRIDYVISAKDSLFGNYTISDGQRDAPQADTYYTMYVPLRTQTLGVQETHVFSPTVVNSTILGWVRPYASSVTQPNGTGPAIPANLIFLPPV